MVFFTVRELIDIIIMSAALGYIFMGIFPRHSQFDIKRYTSRFNIEDFKFAIIVTAPAVIFHELGHKFVAIYFGFEAVFHAFLPGLLIGIVLKLMNFGLIFVIPGFVSVSPGAAPLQQALISFAGPGVNLALWLGSMYIIKSRMVSGKYLPLALLTKQINMFLFFFNMLPIRPFDGSSVFSYLAQVIF